MPVTCIEYSNEQLREQALVNRFVMVNESPDIEHEGVGEVTKGSPQFNKVQLAAPLVNLPVYQPGN